MCRGGGAADKLGSAAGTLLLLRVTPLRRHCGTTRPARSRCNSRHPAVRAYRAQPTRSAPAPTNAPSGAARCCWCPAAAAPGPATAHRPPDALHHHHCHPSTAGLWQGAWGPHGGAGWGALHAGGRARRCVSDTSYPLLAAACCPRPHTLSSTRLRACPMAWAAPLPAVTTSSSPATPASRTRTAPAPTARRPRAAAWPAATPTRAGACSGRDP